MNRAHAILASYVAVIAALLFAVPAHAATHCRGTNGRFIKCPPPPAPTPAPTPAPAPAPTPTPTPTPTPSPSDNPMVGQAPGVGAPDIATTDHDVMNDLTPMGLPASDASVPPSQYDVGAFRFVCGHTNLAHDDPTVFPGQPGKSHLHDQTGVHGWNAYSNYVNLRTGGGGSECNNVAGADGLNQPVIANDPKANWAANRTPYWQPALLDGKGNAILVDYTVFYYKNMPRSAPLCSDPSNPQYMGKCVPLPNAIKFLFGGHPENSSLPVDGARPDGSYSPIKFMCDKPDGSIQSSFTDFNAMVQCVRNSAGQLEVRAEAPGCWDGVNLNTPDHRSHLAYPSYGWWGYQKCDDQHPFIIPAFTYAAFYTILPSDDGDIHFASDEMDNSKPRGWSFHVDYGPAAWDPTVLAMWQSNCIDKLLSCNSGNLGNGYGLKGAAVPIYNVGGVWRSAWRNPARLVPVPAS